MSALDGILGGELDSLQLMVHLMEHLMVYLMVR